MHFNYKNVAVLLLVSLFTFVGCKKDNDGNDSGNNPVVDPANSLCFTAEEDSVTIAMKIVGQVETLPNVEYSFDNKVWNDFVPAETVVLLANTGKKVYFRGDNPEGFSLGDGINGGFFSFIINDKRVAASGNVMSLVDPNCKTKVIPCAKCFNRLFEKTSITSAPELPATTLTELCYYYMFFNCKNLTESPVLPATTLAPHCYTSMFCFCENLTAVELPATTLVDGCYYEMFLKCDNLTSVKVHFTEWSDATEAWFALTSHSGTFYCPSALPQEFGSSRIPNGWTVENF